MFIAFTRKAAREARERVISGLKLHHDRVPWFRTLHSLAFELLGLERRNVMNAHDYIKIAQPLGLVITAGGFREDGETWGMTKGDRLFFAENMARATGVTLREHWEKRPNEDIYWYELLRVHETLTRYKSFHVKMDFTDMVMELIKRQLTVGAARALIVDEAQDLTPLQWDMIELLAREVEVVYVAGDDDQAIFRWAGADVQKLIDLAGDRRILMQSYRVPGLVQHVANSIAMKISNRVPKTWNPRPEAGKVQYNTSIDEIDMSQGSWLLLARNSYLLDDYIHHCLREGFIFESHRDGTTRSDAYSAIVTYEKLIRGEACTALDCKTMYSMMTRKYVAWGSKTVIERTPDDAMFNIADLRDQYGLLARGSWDECLDKLTPVERAYFTAAVDRGEVLRGPPRIKISTIHSVKGGEADNVVVRTEMADRTWNEFHDNPDDEHRVWYVATTRAKESLHILQPTTNKAYEC